MALFKKPTAPVTIPFRLFTFVHNDVHKTYWPTNKGLAWPSYFWDAYNRKHDLIYRATLYYDVNKTTEWNVRRLLDFINYEASVGHLENYNGVKPPSYYPLVSLTDMQSEHSSKSDYSMDQIIYIPDVKVYGVASTGSASTGSLI